MLGLIKAWLEMPVEGDDGEGGKRRTNRARRGRRGTPQGAPVSPVLSNLYMRRFILGWKRLGYRGVPANIRRAGDSGSDRALHRATPRP